MARHTLLRVGVLLLALAHATASQRPPLEQAVMPPPLSSASSLATCALPIVYGKPDFVGP
jgi:hypothetical protein